jgi:hypothetical protein
MFYSCLSLKILSHFSAFLRSVCSGMACDVPILRAWSCSTSTHGVGLSGDTNQRAGWASALSVNTRIASTGLPLVSYCPSGHHLPRPLFQPLNPPSQPHRPLPRLKCKVEGFSLFYPRISLQILKMHARHLKHL